LQAGVGIFLRPWLAGLVINNDNTVARHAVDAIHASNHHSGANPDLEFLLGMQNLRMWFTLCGSQEVGQLRDPLLLVKIMLIPVLQGCLRQVTSKHFHQLVPGDDSLESDRVIVGAQHSMHAGAILHGSRYFSRNSPLALQLKLHGTYVIELDRSRAEIAGETNSWLCRKPLGEIRDLQFGGFLLGEQLNLHGPRLSGAAMCRDTGLL